MPSVNPTVPIADDVSNRHFKKGIFSAVLMATAPVNERTKYMISIVDAFFTT